ncbi:MAG TPA: lysylphosphatidylglycerol synthase transmembrane domain-containing protein [Candidatus Acidoferrales bacterium]|nr:lysylphosphatidylglycerol synthase transmembrane domain-containing protein [Candidatus Acidoferrales bacterium]
MSQSPKTEHTASPHPYRAFAMRAGLGVALVAFLLWRYDARPIFRILSREREDCFAAAVALYLGCQALSSYRWQLLAALLKVHGRYREFLAYYFVGMFTNLLVPGLVGGDAAKSVYLGRRHGRMGEAIASVVADRAVGLLGLFWLVALAAIFLHPASIPSWMIAAAIAAGVVTLAGLLLSPQIARLIHSMPRPLRRAGGIVAPYLYNPAALIPAIALSIVLQIGLAVGQYLLAVGLGMTVPLSLFIFCVPVANVFASLPVTFNGLGIRESAYLLLFGMAGMRKEEAIALGLLWFAATMVGGLTGAIAFVSTQAPIGEG